MQKPRVQMWNGGAPISNGGGWGGGTTSFRILENQREFRILIIVAATARKIRLILEAIITSHTVTTYHVEHNAQGTPPHHGFSLLISVEYACVEHYPWVYCIG